MSRDFLAGVGCPVAGATYRDGALALACGGAEPRSRCLLDGDIYTLAEIAEIAGIAVGDPEETLHAAWQRLGDQGLAALLRGAFALVLWEPEGRRVLALRDQTGERGLFWSAHEGGVLLAGEVAAIVRALPRAPDPDEYALACWLSGEGMPEDRTLFAGVRRVRPGHWLELSASEPRTRRYWRPQPPSATPGIEPADAAGLIRAALATAIRRRAGANTGVLLSGGLDSGAVAGIAAETIGLRSAYSAVFPSHPSADEAPLIALTCKRLRIELVTATVDGGSVVHGALPFLADALVPPATPNLFFWLPLLRRAAADGVTTLLDGQGGDEVFALSPMLLADRLRRGDVRGALALVGQVPGALGHPPPRAAAHWLYQYGLKALMPAVLARLRARVAGPREQPLPWLGPALAAAVRDSSQPGAWKQPGAPRWWAHQVAAIVDGPGPNLAFDDLRRRDGLAGVQSAHPLMDIDLIELVLSLPPELAYNPYISRPLLRRAVEGAVPDEVRLRAAKSNFDGPFHQALAGVDLPLARRLLGDDAELHAYVDLGRARAALLEQIPPTGQRQRWGIQLWRLLTAELWLRTIADRDYPNRVAAEAGAVENRVIVA